MQRREFVSNASVLALAAAHPFHVSGAVTIRVGVIGCGGRGTEASLQAMNADDGVRLVAMADIVPDRIRARRDELRAKKPDQVAVQNDMCFAGFDAYKAVID